MTVEDVKERLAKIESIMLDDQQAHSMEDDLYYDFIVFVASHTWGVDLPDIAKEVLKTKDMGFARWYA